MFHTETRVILFAILGIYSQIALVASMPNPVSPTTVSDYVSPADQMNPFVDESAKASVHLYYLGSTDNVPSPC